MAELQYIGARYVPKFFEGSNGSDWVANTQYEALTIVTRNGNSYTSKIPVPASVGAPELNPDYWVSTGIYNQQLQNYINQVNEYKEDVEQFIENSAVKPEDFGAVGDGVTDDYNAFVNALATGKPVVGNQNYYLSAPLTLPFNSNLICHGELTAPGGLIFNNTDVHCYIKKLSGSGTGSGIIFNDPPTSVNLGACARNNVIVGIINNFANAIDMYAELNRRGIQYNRIVFDRIINATNGIRMRTSGERTWINQNQIIGGSIYGGNADLIHTGVLAVADLNVEYTEITSNKFENIVFEGIEDAAIDMTNCLGNMFVDCRLAEEIHGNYWVKLQGSGANYFSGYLNFSVAKIKDDMRSDWDTNIAYARANRFEFFNLQSGSASWHGKQGMWSFNNQFCYDYATNAQTNVNTDNANYDYNTEYNFASSTCGNGIKISMQSGGNLTLPSMFDSYMTEIVVFNKGEGNITVKKADGTTIGTITGYGNHLIKWTTGGLLVL